MADLKTFAAFDINTLYTDVADSEKGFHGAHATMVHNGYASPPLGAVNFDNPGGTTRSLTQWNGTAYVGFNANSPGGYQATIYYFNLANCTIQQDIGTGNPGFLFDVGDYMDYSRSGNRWQVAIGNAFKLTVDAATTQIYTESFVHSFTGTANKFTFSTGAPVDQKYSSEVISPTNIVRNLINDAFTQANPYDTTTRVGAALTTRQLNQTSGRLLVGQGLTDDGVTALQTTSLKAQSITLTAQPFMKFNGSISIGTGFGFTPQYSSGITVNGPNSSNLTVSKSGKYIISIEELTAVSTNASQNEFLFNLKKNGGLYSYLRAAFTGNTSSYRGTGQSVVLDLLAGDSLSIDRADGLAQTASLSGFLYQLS